MKKFGRYRVKMPNYNPILLPQNQDYDFAKSVSINYEITLNIIVHINMLLNYCILNIEIFLVRNSLFYSMNN